MKTKQIALFLCCFMLLLLAACSEPETRKESETATLPRPVTEADATIPATSAGPTHTVTFFSDDGTILKIQRVLDGETAEPPVEPQMSYGSIFSHWEENYSQVHDDLEVHPSCKSFLGHTNVLALTGASGRTGEDCFVSLLLCGDVQVSGLDLAVNYDPEALQLQSLYNEDGGVVYNDEIPGQILINYVSARNTVGDVDLCSFKFRMLADSGETPLSIQLNSIYANKDDSGDVLITPNYELFDAVVRVDQ